VPQQSLEMLVEEYLRAEGELEAKPC